MITNKVKSLLKFFLCALFICSCSTDDTELQEEKNLNGTIKEFKQQANNTTTLQWNGQPGSLAGALINAVKRVGNGGTVFLPKRVYKTDRAIILPNIKVAIKGSGRNNTRIEATKKVQTAGLIVTGANGTSFENFTVDWKGLNNASCAISSNGKNYVKAINMRFANAGYGFGTPDNGTGLPINGLYAFNCEFINCLRGIAFVRYFSKKPVWKINRAIIDKCQFKGNQVVGISIDSGNDGSDGRFNLRNQNRAAQAKQVVTDMDGMQIKRCYFGKAHNFNIAIAKSKNISIFGNTLEGTTGKGSFTEAINIEHESSNININGNKIKNYAKGNTSHAYISMVSFRDYGNKPLFENGVKQIYINGNTFEGNCVLGITGEETNGITIRGNKFNSPSPTSHHINLFRSHRGNKNTFIKDNTNTPNWKIRLMPFR